MGWIKTADRLPTEADGIEYAGGDNAVVAMTAYAHGYFPEVKAVSDIRESADRGLAWKYYPYWMPIPKLPD